MKSKYDFIVIGSGLAGLAFALHAAEKGSVAIVSKCRLNHTNTDLAQGGIASVTTLSDSIENHIQDTIDAGAGLCDPKSVEDIISHGPERIEDLVKWGVKFDQKANKYELTKEGGHSARRILHVQDHTGHAIQEALIAQVKKHPQIDLLENQFAVDLITTHSSNPSEPGPNKCLGVWLLDKKTSQYHFLQGKFTALATGGAGKVYLYTSNWSGATGDGIAMAYRAGARISNLEFMQFHPTCLYHPEARNFLISEALRGEGGELIDKNGFAFMSQFSPMGSLAPRDIVARSIDAVMKRSGDECVYLDMTHLPKSFLKKRFPVIFAKCESLQIDISKQPIPVVPAAHYLCGGVLTDTSGKTDIENLFAIGETGCTGLHGANRLASNSLLECLVVAKKAIETVSNEDLAVNHPKINQQSRKQLKENNSDELILVSYMWEEIRRLMWAYVGIVRSNKRLERAQNRLNTINNEIREYYSNFKPNSDIEELRNIAMVADLTVKCALQRKDSIGIHYNIDCTRKSKNSVNTVVSHRSL